MKKTGKDGKWKYRSSVISMILVLLFAIAGIFLFLKFYDSYIDTTLYEERLSQMSEVTTQLFSGLEDVVGNQWDKASDSCRKLLDARPESLEEFLAFLEKQAYLEEFDSRQMDFVAVDQDGRYYTQNGEQGLLGERNYLIEEPKQISFVSNSLTYEESRMIFLDQLSEPVTMKKGEKTITVTYFGVSQNMEALNPYFRCAAYEGNSSVYVMDDDGLKLFSSSNDSGDLLKGFNVYTSLGNLEYLHGSSFVSAKEALDADGLAYSNALLEDGREIYYALYQMDSAAWTLIFLVPSEYVAQNTVQLIDMTIRMVLIFAISLVTVSIIAIFFLMKIQQKEALAAEKKNNEVLEKVNEELRDAVEKAARATKEAQAASKAKSDFLANMSHDIRTPMNAIVGITGLMEHESGISDKLRSYIDKVQLSSRHLLGLINDILDMSRIESKEVKLNVEQVSLAEQVGQIDSIIRAQTNEHGQRFHIHVNEIVHEYLLCDGVRLRQVVLNLLSNAVKYTPNGGDVTLDLIELPCDVPDHAKFMITVTDNGYGMTEEFVGHIFEPFTRAENSVTNKVQGTGLGMAITKNIVDLMGGEIRVESEIGRGSRFEVTLTMPINQSRNCALGERRILLITKEDRLRRNVRASVSEAPVELCAVSTPEEANGWLTQEHADIILLGDCRKNPALAATVAQLKEMAGNTTLVFCVDYLQDEKVENRILTSGADGAITRPFFLSGLETAVAKTITGAVSEQENDSILKGMHFLCAEDNELNAEILREILSMYGADCTIYPNGLAITQAFQEVKPGEYDAILMDIQMPGVNGLEATRMIRGGKNPLGKTIPIIAMTANAFSEDVQLCMGAGMDAHIAKPLDIAVLEKTIRGLSIGGGQTLPKNIRMKEYQSNKKGG